MFDERDFLGCLVQMLSELLFGFLACCFGFFLAILWGLVANFGLTKTGFLMLLSCFTI